MPSILVLLATKYGLFKITYKSNRATCYRLKDPKAVEEALNDIEAKKISLPEEENVVLRVCLSKETAKRLRRYIDDELPECWDVENLVIERALNSFLDRYESEGHKGKNT